MTRYCVASIALAVTALVGCLTEPQPVAKPAPQGDEKP